MIFKLPGFGSKEPDPTKKPTAEDFKGGAIEGSVFKDALQHPATIYPAALSLLSVFWTIVINPSPQSIGAACLFAVIGASAFVWNYIVKGPEKAKIRVEQLREARAAHELLDLVDLKAQCEQAGYIDGAKEVGELKAAYEHLLGYIKAQKQDLSLEQFRILAQDTFRQGVRVLTQALDLFKALSTIDVKTLKREVKEWQSEKELRNDDTSAASIALDTQIESHQLRIERHQQGLEKLAELISVVNQIEAALEKTHLELVDLGKQDPTALITGDGGAVTRLTRMVDAARRVEERHRGRDAEASQIRDEYIKASE